MASALHIATLCLRVYSVAKMMFDGGADWRVARAMLRTTAVARWTRPVAARRSPSVRVISAFSAPSTPSKTVRHKRNEVFRCLLSHPVSIGQDSVSSDSRWSTGCKLDRTCGGGVHLRATIIPIAFASVSEWPDCMGCRDYLTTTDSKKSCMGCLVLEELCRPTRLSCDALNIKDARYRHRRLPSCKFNASFAARCQTDIVYEIAQGLYLTTKIDFCICY